MITRIVKLTIQKEHIATFQSIFEANNAKIGQFPGCKLVKGYQSISEKNIFFTYSIWDSEDALNAYRKSELFGSIWPKTKSLFLAPAEAHTVESL